ncbi:hypothetical protein K466DRAFT_582148 [Polyporus arcularius HHB13444]|uniref:Uncharacterized protein n=1 Tax=Polyporus arcularius HHB13444 TaxID=1314778 RepID=A0A5C3PW91_9APHY|nr:hypothetical protein K466DRAFT_582148 [Polyporus arcularius HHB13444]
MHAPLIPHFLPLKNYGLPTRLWRWEGAWVHRRGIGRPQRQPVDCDIVRRNGVVILCVLSNAAIACYRSALHSSNSALQQGIEMTQERLRSRRSQSVAMLAVMVTRREVELISSVESKFRRIKGGSSRRPMPGATIACQTCTDASNVEVAKAEG